MLSINGEKRNLPKSMRIHLPTFKQQIGHDEEINTYTRTKFFLEKGFRSDASQTADCKDYRDTYVQSWFREKDRKYYLTHIIQEKLKAFIQK